MWISRQRRLSAGFFPGSTLDMNFAQSRYLGATPSSLTVTRASDGYAEDSAGTWSVFTSNVPRITNRGLLVEEARTNGVRNNSMQGTVAGTPGTQPTNWSITGSSLGLTREIVGIGTENGVDYIDVRYSGTASSGGNLDIFPDGQTGGPAALNGQNWTQSLFVKLQAGSLNGLALAFRATQLAADGTTNVGSIGGSAIVPTGALTRVSQLYTLNAPTTAFLQVLVRITVTISAVVDCTLRIGWPQLELGAFATSPIRTTTVAVARAADDVRLTGGAFSSWFTSSTAYTLYGEGVWNAPGTSTAGSQWLASINDGTSNNRVSMFRNLGSTSMLARVASGGVQTNPTIATAMTDFAVIKVALASAVGANQANIAMTGVLGTAATPAAMPVSPTTLHIGQIDGGGLEYMSGYVRRLAYFPSRLADASLQSLTT